MTDKTTTKPAHKLSDRVLAIAELTTEHVTIDAAGVGKEKTSIYEAGLPDNLTMEAVENVSKYNTDYIAGTAHGFANLSIAAMKSNGKLAETQLELKMGVHDTLALAMTRHKEETTSFEKDEAGNPIAKTTDVYGKTRVNYTTRAASNTGALKSVRNMAKEAAQAALAKG